MRTTLWVFFVTKIPVIGIALLSSAFIPVSGHGHPVASTNPVLNIFARWDAVHYLEIARSGYHGADLAFFPLYPFLIRIGGWLLGSDVVAGLLVANIAFLFALYFLYRIAEAQFDSNVAARAALYLAIFPTAFFFVSLYSESLFLALTLAMFYALREQKWLIAGFVGGLAALTRVEGVLLVVCYIVEVLRPERNMLAAIRNSRAVRQHLLMGAGMIPGWLVAYMLLSWVLSNDPLAFTHLQSHWNRHPAWPWMSIWDTLVILATSRNPATLAVQSIQLAFTSLVICTTVYGLRRIRPSYSVFAAMSILVPLSTASLMSTPRFALAIFPVFIILGLWGKRDRVHTAVLLMALPLLGFFTVLFANWYWVA
jgi:Gpi18-like mannosyltransferase